MNSAVSETDCSRVSLLVIVALFSTLTATASLGQNIDDATRHSASAPVPLPELSEDTPVNLSRFDATAEEQMVRLRWTTTSEIRNAGFDVEWATVSSSFQSVGFVSGLGTTEETNDYEFTVDGLSAGTHAFRLRHVNYDGTSSFSPTVEVDVEEPVTHMVSTAYDAPNKSGVQMQLFVANDENVKIDLFDIAGQRVVSVFDGRIAANDIKYVGLRGETLPNGRYVVRVIGESFRDSQVISIIN